MTLSGAPGAKKQRGRPKQELTKRKEGPMKKRIFVMTSLLLLSLMVAAQVVQAQEPVVVNIPFEFVAGNVTLPAGEYRVEKLEKNSVVVLTHCAQPGASAIVMTIASQANAPQSNSKLVFNHYGNLYFLSQYWTAGNSSGRLLLKSAREEEISRIARNETQGQVTLVASLSPAPR
jgi:hypothetical protein